MKVSDVHKQQGISIFWNNHFHNRKQNVLYLTLDKVDKKCRFISSFFGDLKRLLLDALS